MWYGYKISHINFGSSNSQYTKATLSGRVRDGAGRDVFKKQLQGLTDSLPEMFDLKTGRLTTKKPKKEKTPEELVMADVKKLHKKWLTIT